jgi:quercetin dioxygenase-like cupin family protein
VPDFVVRRWELDPYPGDQAPRHVHHGSDEAFCVIGGLLDVQLGDERRRLTPGEFLVVPAGTVHTFATVNDTPAVVLAVMTPEVDQLVTALHAASREQERAQTWARYNSSLAD